MILFVAATREELGDLPGETLGLGAVSAAARTATLIAMDRPDGVVLLGSCGGYPCGPTIGEAVVARRVGLSSGVSAMGLGYVPASPEPVLCDAHLVGRLPIRRVDVLTVHAITTDPVLAQRLSDGWDVEHLEAFGAARACAMAGVPFSAVLGVASEVGPDAHTHWLLHRQDALNAARAAITPLLAEPSA